MGREVVVDAEELARTLQHCLLLLRELRHPPTGGLLHRGWVIAKVDGVHEPTQLEVPHALDCLNLVRIAHVEGHGEVRVHCDADHSLLLGLELVAVQLHAVAVPEDHVVSDRVGVDGGAPHPVRPSHRRHVVEGHDEGLVERDPVLHPVAEALEADPRVPDEGLDDAVLWAEQALKLVVHGTRQVPMEECHPGIDLVSHQLIHQVVVKLHALLVHWPLVSIRDDAAPGHGEPVGRQPQLCHEAHVVAEAVVVVVSYVSGLEVDAHALQSLAVCDVVPDRRTATAFRSSTLDLVSGRRCAPGKVLRELLEAGLDSGRCLAALRRLWPRLVHRKWLAVVELLDILVAARVGHGRENNEGSGCLSVC
mmetsp:Transcript_62312/g.140393  ORF Transcript_62312/g.140393 Transcript_62312/m.140393 type:complete len:364 (+) Transcript_62312:772-1863(+)